ncbi:MAG: SDR family oxidoreductase [Alicyclobacillus sp.]|nr:SDR family oxidoreductase [Alicyclobacillus sp.]
MDLGLSDKTVLVLASSRGLGFATAKAFAREGARVMLTSRSEQALARAVAEIVQETGNHDVAYTPADVSRADDIERLFASVEARFGGVDVLINNAGGPPLGTFDSVQEEQWETAHQLTLMSVVRTVRRALPYMRKNQWGRIINFTSSSIRQPLENLILSNTYRAAILGLSKSLAIELAPDNILVNTLAPGRIATERVMELDATKAQQQGVSVAEIARQSQSLIPLGRYGQPDEFAAVAVFLGSAVNSYLTGQAILVDGAMVKAL